MNMLNDIKHTFFNKSVLITGGTGTFGKAFVKFLLSETSPQSIRIFSRDELKQSEMMEQFKSSKLRFQIGDIRDRDRVYRATKGCDIIIHTAAMKQVPSCEYNPFEAVKTNIYGTQNIIDSAIDNQVDKVVTISTDKAANPFNLYGATKLCAEKLTIHGNYYAGGTDTKLYCVRYGNVLGSRGSVMNIFKESKASGELNITDPRMSRFWITIDNAVEFVAQTLCISKGSEIFIPKLPSMNVVDLAYAMCPDCGHIITGIRPGEKLYETLVTCDESKNCYEFDDFYVLLTDIAPYDKSSVKNAKLVKEHFEYRSDTNPWMLKKEEILNLLKKM